jgi:hypothetical protein
MDHTARLWDVASGKLIRTLQGHSGDVDSVVFSPDGRSIFTASWDHTARQWDKETGALAREYKGNANIVWSVATSPDGRFLITGGEDTTTRLWETATGNQVASILSFEKAGWAVTDPQGRFDTSDLDGNASLVWVASDEPMRALPIEIFMRDYYTPRLLSRILNQEPLPGVRSIAEIKNRVQPEVAITSVTAIKNHAESVNVVVHAASQTGENGSMSGLRDLRLFRDGQLVANSAMDLSLEDGDFEFKNLRLPSGEKRVTFTAYAFNSERIKSRTATKDYAYQPAASPRKRAWLLQIGVNHYQAAGCDLHGSVTDAEQLSQLLSDRLKRQGFDVKALRLVSTDSQSQATKSGIRDAITKIAGQATPDDFLFLSFSGHGYDDKTGEFYVFPGDIQGNCSSVNDELLRRAISADELAQWLRPIDVGEMVFVLDSCQSASSVEANDLKPGPMGSRGLGQLAYDKRMRILAASQSTQEAQERNLPAGEGPGKIRTQGLLSYTLVQQGLVEGNADWKPVDGKITLREWLGYAVDAVPKQLDTGTVNTGRGLIVIGPPAKVVSARQVPTLFDFSRSDGIVMQLKQATGNR